MAITTDFIGRIGIEPALSAEQIGDLTALREPTYGDLRPSGWVASDDGRYLTLDGDNRYGNQAQWLRYVVKTFIKPAGLQADGMVVGCRRGTHDLVSLQVTDNRVTERTLWSRQARAARRQPRPPDNVIDLAARRAR